MSRFFNTFPRRKTVEIDIERLERLMNSDIRNDNVTGNQNIAIGYQALYTNCSGVENTQLGGVPVLYPEINRPICPPPAPRPQYEHEHRTCKHCGAPEQIVKCQYCGCAIPRRRMR